MEIVVGGAFMPAVGGAFMPAPPMYRPGERIDGPLADTSALRQYIVRLRGITDLIFRILDFS